MMASVSVMMAHEQSQLSHRSITRNGPRVADSGEELHFIDDQVRTWEHRETVVQGETQIEAVVA